MIFKLCIAANLMIHKKHLPHSTISKKIITVLLFFFNLFDNAIPTPSIIFATIGELP